MLRKIIIMFVIVFFSSLIIAISGFAEQEQVTIRLMDKHLTEEPGGTIMRNLVAEFEKQHPNIKVELDPVTTPQMWEKFLISYRGGAAPDVYKTTMQIPAAVGLDMLMPLDSFVEEEENFLDNYYTSMLQPLKVNGKLYAMPQMASVYGIFYNKEMFKEAGLAPDLMGTWTDFLSYAMKLTKDTNQDGIVDQYGIAIPGATTSVRQRVLCFLHSNGAKILDEETGQVLLDTPEAIEAFRFYIELYTLYNVVPPGVTSAGYEETRLAFAHERAAMIIAGAFLRDSIIVDNPNMKDKIGVLPMPTNRSQGTWQVITSFSITNQTKHPKEAWELVKFLTNKESQIAWAQGTGWNVPHKGAEESFSDDPYYQKFNSFLSYAQPDPQVPQVNEIIDILIDEVQEAFMETKTPEQAARDAANKIRRVLE